ncbi:hypothetical protein [Sporolactobacillus terrae]|uniref:hypothetical protein n=1 Tax=Sporolactobacillus terrae TaxID=269673 RepID=UPI001CBAE069|nr:hypothetical protein [Sporolactobacillus terrae]UAK18098.1 hypothetical protein K7399_16040 [Sporolactobacillus terrae]
MKEPKSQQEKINTLEMELESLDNKIQIMKKDLKGRDQWDYRRKRAHRLIQTGALAEKYFGIENLSLTEREELFLMFASFIKSNMPERLKK